MGAWQDWVILRGLFSEEGTGVIHKTEFSKSLFGLSLSIDVKQLMDLPLTPAQGEEEK